MPEQGSRKTKHRFPKNKNIGMNEMMKNFCSNREWDSNCCAQFMRMYRSGNDCEDCIMTMCERMQEMCSCSDLNSENS